VVKFLWGATITVVSYADGRIELLRDDEILPFKVFDPLQYVPPAADNKTLNARVDEVLAQQRQVNKYHPHQIIRGAHQCLWQKPDISTLL
jgi:hypothetical protein